MFDGGGNRLVISLNSNNPLVYDQFNELNESLLNTIQDLMGLRNKDQ